MKTSKTLEKSEEKSIVIDSSMPRIFPRIFTLPPMFFELLNTLFCWTIPSKYERTLFRKICVGLSLKIETEKVQKNYIKLINKFRNSSQKYKVLFLVNETCKWKAQSLFERMKEDENFEPVIALTIADIQKKLSKEEKEQILKDNAEFFAKRGMETVFAYKDNKPVDLKKLDAQIIFYQQPYNIPKNQQPSRVSKFAITCYIPYYLPEFRNFEIDCEQSLHTLLYKFYVLNDSLKQNCQNHLKEMGRYSENICAVGHTMIDNFRKYKHTNNKQYVIYAPHWSIPHEKNRNTINLSTFLETGELILNWAKQHPELNWLFKPHPTLKHKLKQIGEWSDEKIENYWKEWENLADCCYNGDYLDVFFDSKAMITDCGSFLIEYFLTGKPLIHLVSGANEHTPHIFMRRLLNLLYAAETEKELYNYLDNVILNNNDYMLKDRLDYIKSSKILETNAALNILNNLKKELNIL